MRVPSRVLFWLCNSPATSHTLVWLDRISSPVYYRSLFPYFIAYIGLGQDWGVVGRPYLWRNGTQAHAGPHCLYASMSDEAYSVMQRERMSAILGTPLHILANDLSSMGKMKHKPVQSPFSAERDRIDFKVQPQICQEALSEVESERQRGNPGYKTEWLWVCFRFQWFQRCFTVPEFKVWPLPHWQRELGSMAIATFWM